MISIIKKLDKRSAKTDIFFLTTIIAVFILLRIPSLIEPLWYGDEAIYQVVGDALNSGRVLYLEIWDNKPPLLYYIYALANSDMYIIKLLSLIFGALSIIPFFLLAKKLFKDKYAYLSTSLYAILFSIPLLEGNIANAENFMLLPVITSAMLIYKKVLNNNTTPRSLQITYFIAGLLLGISFMLKIVAVFDLFAFLLFIFIYIFYSKNHPAGFKIKTKKIIDTFFMICTGFILPLLFFTIYFYLNGSFTSFIQSAFFENIGYVEYANTLIIPQGLLILKVIILLILVILIFRNAKSMSSPVLFIFIWFTFSLWNALFSGRAWTHYLLTVLPSFSLLFSFLFYKQKTIKTVTIIAIAVLIYFSHTHFRLDTRSFSNSMRYYINFLQYTSGNLSVNDYRSFFDQDVLRDYAIAKYLNSKSTPADNIFIWGNNPQIYHLSDKLPPGRYTVAYHVIQNPGATGETKKTLQKSDPKYIVILEDEPGYPFSLNNYIYVYNIKGARIYEKSD